VVDPFDSPVRGRARNGADDGWSAATPVQSGSARRPGAAPAARRNATSAPVDPPRVRREVQLPVPAAGRVRGSHTRSAAPGFVERVGAPTRSAVAFDTRRSYDPASVAGYRPRRAAPGRGLPGWAALGVLVGIAAAAGVIDAASSSQQSGAFNIGIVVASAVAILVVRRNEMLPVVLAPPIVYSGAAMLMLYIRSGGLHDKNALVNAALNYLVYGFPAIATATAIVLLVAAVRMLARR